MLAHPDAPRPSSEHLTLSTLGLEDQVRTQGIRGTIRFLLETWTGQWIDIALLKAGCLKQPRLRLIV